jgi:SAM-dependent methyltransferase
MDETAKPNFFRRMDESEDEDFYRRPRRVVHIDDGAIATIGEIYASHIKPGSEILDLMSSWRSHLPAAMRPTRVTGLGLNAEEMHDNPALTEVVVHNVNREPQMPFPDQSFDAVVMTVSVQYLTRPIEIFADVGRVLRQDGPFIVTFSNRMFPTKAVALWQASTNEQRVAVVKSYFAQCNAFERIEAIDRSQREGEPSDPVWAVLGHASGAR